MNHDFKDFSILAMLLGLLENRSGISNDTIDQIVQIGGKKISGICLRHHILLRIHERLQAMDLSIGAEFDACVFSEKKRVSSLIAAIKRIHGFFEENKINAIFIKLWNHYPDMGEDIDILIPESGIHPDTLMFTGFDCKKVKNNFFDKFSGKNEYVLMPDHQEIEIHLGKIGFLGEFTRFSMQIGNNSRQSIGFPVNVTIPSEEDQLLLSVIARVYHHAYFRICDIVNAAVLLRRKDLNREYIESESESQGIINGTRYFISLVNSVYRSSTGSHCVDNEKTGLGMVRNRKTPFRVRHYCYSVPKVRISLLLFLEKVFSDVLKNRWDSAFFLMLFPCFAMYCILRKAHRGFFMRKYDKTTI
jgi:hypothetical protein